MLDKNPALKALQKQNSRSSQKSKGLSQRIKLMTETMGKREDAFDLVKEKKEKVKTKIKD